MMHRSCPADAARRQILSAIVLSLPTRCLVLGAAIAAGLAAPAFAGLEDGLAAYDQGDYATAYRELAPAAAGGAPEAEYALARMYLSGEGVSRDAATGLKWLREAAAAGFGLAQYQLGVCYELGIVTSRDYGEAARWYRIAADRGVPLAQYHLGLFYFNGLGVAADLVAAHMWLNLAAARLPPGEPRNAVASVRETVASKMTGSQIAQAQKAARDWTPGEGRSSEAAEPAGR